MSRSSTQRNGARGNLGWVSMILWIGLFETGVATAGGHPAGKVALGMPSDSVLATIGNHRVVTRRDFDEAWTRAGWPADSITPGARRRFLGFLVDREVLAARAARETWLWTPAESAGYLALLDRLRMSAALDSALGAMASRWSASGEPIPGPEELGTRLRDSVLAGMAVSFDEPLVARLALAWARLPRPNADSSAAAQIRMLSALPVLDPGDAPAIVARSTQGPYRASEMLEAWQKLGVAYRPRVETAEQVRDLVRNGLFERALRARAEAAGLERRPDIAVALAKAREEIAVAHLLERDVLNVKEPREADLRALHERTRERWRVPTRVRALELVSGTRAEADRLALELRDPARAESLAVMARRRGLDFTTHITATSDSSTFARALAAGAGVVLGPDPQGDSWRVLRIQAIVPSRMPALSDVRRDLERIWATEETQRRLERICRKWRAQERVRLNQAALSGGSELPGPHHAGP